MGARIEYFSLGGTIASLHRDAPGAVPALDAADLIRDIPGMVSTDGAARLLDQRIDVHPHAFRRTPSMDLTLADLIELVDTLHAAAADGANGFVVSQGTDSIEETAFALDLLWGRDEPVVVTGAMRSPSLAGADGPANLLAAVQLAASEAARGLGALVVMSDEIHAARFVHKGHTAAVGAFHSPGLGPLGWVTEGRPRILLRPARTPSHTLTSGPTPRVALVRTAFGDDGGLLAALATDHWDGVVVEGMGGGHVPAAALPHLDTLLGRMPVVLASRTGAGPVLTESYRYPGSEIDLRERGCISAGTLDGLKARLLLTVALAAGAGPRAVFAAHE